VRCRQNHNTFGTVKTIHLCQKLVQRLFPFVIAANLSVPLFTDGIDLINEDDTRRLLVRLFEEVTHFGSAHSDKHLYELRSGNGEERNICLSGYCLGKQSLTGTRRAYEKGSFRHGSTDLSVSCRIMKEINDLT